MSKHKSQKSNPYPILLGLFFLFIISFHFYNKKPEVEIPQKEVLSYIPQFVVLSFDGSKSLEMWRNTRAFAREMNASSTKVHFTYFINPIYLLTKEKASIYQGPRHLPGQSAIGFANSEDDVQERLNDINSAMAEGHEIGSHAVGHFVGGDWSYDEWKQEFDMFDKIIKLNLQGFRAPELSINDNAYRLLKDRNFRYDASGVAKGDAWPFKDKRGLWRYSLGTIFIKHRAILAMDYNIWMYQKDGLQGNIENFKDVVTGYTDYFEKNYKGNRAPVIIGHHFSGWGDNIYWEAMKSFARDVCTRPQVKCVSFAELTDYLDEYGVPALVKK